MIQRWILEVYYDDAYMSRDDDGDYVRYEDMPPREPTELMLKAGSLVFMREKQKRIPKWDPEIAGRFWRAMYDAALKTGGTK